MNHDYPMVHNRGMVNVCLPLLIEFSINLIEELAHWSAEPEFWI